MNGTKHTPGPWFPVENSSYWEVRTERTNHYGEQIGDVCASKFIDGQDDNPVAIANVHLMAAAPELLEACQMLLVCMSLANWEGDPAAEKARAAIAKALGA